jgi:competence protein ComEC
MSFKIGVALVFLLLIAPVLFFVLSSEKTLTVSFLDVGQGDAIFIESPTGKQMLIDGGANGAVLRELGKVMPPWDRTIDIILATHPDADHIGGLSSIFERYEVKHYFLSGAIKNTNPVKELEGSVVHESGLMSHVSHRGTTIDMGGGVLVEILYPDRDISQLDANEASAVVKVSYGTTSFLFTGDAPQWVENQLVFLDGDRLRSTVLKSGHHGSNTSNSPLFLHTVDPDYVVISAGKDNRYGHPHKDVVLHIEESGATMLSTIDDSTIIFTSNGKEVHRK